jgi:putative transposase
MRKCFRYRLKANDETLEKAENWLSLCRQMYNDCLKERIESYKKEKKSISQSQQKKALPLLKRISPQFKQINSQTLQDVIERLDKAFQGFFRRVKNKEKVGFPRFKGQNRYDSFTLKQTGWKLKLKEQSLEIKNIGKFKLIYHRPIEGTIKTITIRKTLTNKWFVSFSCDDVPKKPLPKTGKEIGIDMGCESFLTDSNGSKIDNPRFLNKSQNILTMRQQRLSLRKEGSHRRNKTRVLVAKIQERISNQRKDFHFKVANQLIKSADTIHIEKLKNWKTFKKLNRSLRDVSWFQFFSILKVKAAEAGRQIIEVPAQNTSQICSRCGVEVPKGLKVRIHHCSLCGLTINRDWNSALNILRLGMSLQAQPEKPLTRS